MPPYLAGREIEFHEFKRLLGQSTILENMILTGLRGVGKTVLLETFKPVAINEKWLWVGADLSESTSVSEEHMSIRLMTDLSVVTSQIVIGTQITQRIGFEGEEQREPRTLNFSSLRMIFDNTPGLVADRIKQVLEIVWEELKKFNPRGVVFAYDEAQNLADHAEKEQYPLSLLLDVFQSIQKKGVPFMLALTGLPTLFPKLVEARTFSERMFRVIFLYQLGENDTRDAILKPIEQVGCPVQFTEDSVETIRKLSGGYPYFIQFICREVYDVFIQKFGAGEPPMVPINEIVQKLDSDFFAGRWSKATDRQRELLGVAASLEHSGSEFTVQEIVERSKEFLDKPFSNSHVNQMLASLTQAGLVYKNRHGKYSFAVPLLDRFIRRQLEKPG